MRAILVANTQKHYNATISYASLTTDSEPSEKFLYILVYCKVACHSVGIYIGEFDKIKIDEGLHLFSINDSLWFPESWDLKNTSAHSNTAQSLAIVRFFHKLRDMLFIPSLDD